jgi:hypothetical protein
MIPSHRAGGLAAIRVMSRKLPEKIRRATGSLSPTLTRAEATACGRWLTVATTRSCLSALMRTILHPADRHNPATRATAEGIDRYDETSMQALPRKRSDRAAAIPGVSRPDIGCAPTNMRGSGSNREAREATRAFTEHASVTTVDGESAGPIRRITASMA